MGTNTTYSVSYLIDQNRIWVTMNSLPWLTGPSSATNTLAAILNL
jgi:hypothetical protein